MKDDRTGHGAWFPGRATCKCYGESSFDEGVPDKGRCSKRINASGSRQGRGCGGTGHVSRMESPAKKDLPPGAPGTSFLLDTDIGSADLKNERRVIAKVCLHFGNLSVSAITAGGFLTWALRAKAKPGRLDDVRDLLATNILVVDHAVAEHFGALRAEGLDRGRVADEFDLINAVTTLVHSLTMVTPNTQEHADVPGNPPRRLAGPLTATRFARCR